MQNTSTATVPITSDAVRARLTDCGDAVFCDVALTAAFGGKLTAAFIDGMVSSQIVNDFILKPLSEKRVFAQAFNERELLDLAMNGEVYHGQRKMCGDLETAMEQLLSGALVLIFDGEQAAIAYDSKGYEKRSVSEPTNENVLKGSKESFGEAMRVNTSLVRRRIQTDALKMRTITLGRRTHTSITLVYLDGVANPDTVTRVEERLGSLDVDGIVSTGQIELQLQETRRTIFPLVLYTERVDKFCGNILEGRIGIITDGLPVAYITPNDLHSFLQAPEDYSHNKIISTALRILRYFCSFASLILPAFYVSITTFHQEMIPTKLAVSIIASKQGVPFPTYMEVLLMLLAFEVLLEAGTRLPQSIGQAVSIVGALVVGQAAITANMLSPGVVIVIAAAGITGFVIPSQDFSNTVRLCRIALVLLSTLGGLFMTSIGLIFLLYHMCTLDNFGTPYLSPFVASEGRQMFNDTIVRRSWLMLDERPENIRPADKKRKG
ncbi:MAG: spore germination protein [Oscillospiraceae bacterium]|jgi:spore germination protein KA|nr:spore germination protein [Oscillospiraceae bacterium]